MNSIQTGQSFIDVRWATVMPILVQIDDKMVEVRVRGSLTTTVKDNARLVEVESDPDNVHSVLRSHAVKAMTDLIGARSTEAATRGELITVTSALVERLYYLLLPDLDAIGIKLDSVSIYSIE